MSWAQALLRPQRWPLYYGWIIAVVATIGTIMSVPGQTVGVSVFTDALVESVPHATRVSVAQAYLVGTFGSALSLPFAGRCIDRWGARAVGVAAVGLLAATLVYLSRIDRVVLFVGGGPIAGFALLALGFYTLRLSGQGTLTMVCRTMIGRWFDRRRGMVAAVSGVFVGFSFGYAPKLCDDLIQSVGWSAAWRELAFIELAFTGTLALLFFRSSPESVGLTLEGRSSKPEDASAPPEPALTRGQALRTLAFWAVTAALSSQALIITAVTFHIVDIGATAGLDRGQAVALFLPMSVVSTASAVTLGPLTDRFPVRWVIFVMLGGQVIGLLGCLDLGQGFYAAIFGLGVAGGLFGPLSTVAFPRYFGRLHLGAITGVEMMCIVVGSAVGPALFAWSRSGFNSYAPALLGSLLFPSVSGVLALIYARPTLSGDRPAG